MTRRYMRCLGLLLAVLGTPLGIGPAFPEEPPADVVADLERQVGPRSGGAAACPDAGVYSLARPDPAGAPTVVGLGVFFQDVASLSDVDQTLDADVLVVARWRDPRLADPSRGDASVECPMLEGRTWVPALEPENLRGRQAFYPARFLVDGRGVVTLARRLWVRLSYPLDFRDFPLDRHRWKVTLWPVLSRTDEIVFHPLRRDDLVDVEEGVLLQSDVDERRLHPREDVSDLAEVDVADHATLRTLDVQLNQATVLKDRHTGLVRIVRDEHLASDLSHGMSPLQGATPGFVLFDEEVDTGHAHPCVPTESGRDERFGSE